MNQIWHFLVNKDVFSVLAVSVSAASALVLLVKPRQDLDVEAATENVESNIGKKLSVDS